MKRSTTMMMMAISLATAHGTHAQVNSSGYLLPRDPADEAAREAIRSCEANGFRVSAAGVDANGLLKVMLKGDESTAHTRDSSYRKACTTVTMGPIFNFDTTSQFVEKLKTNPSATAPASIPDILPLAGGVAIRARGEIVAAIGVGSAPGRDKDEACAQAGLGKISARLPAL